jgi:hypothetical protein
MDHRVRTLTTGLTHAESRWTVARAEIERFTAERVDQAALREAENHRQDSESKNAWTRKLRTHTRNESLRIEIESEQRPCLKFNRSLPYGRTPIDCGS